VAILSERDLPELRRLVPVPEVVWAGSLGLDVGTPERGLVSHPHALTFAPILEGAEAALRERIDGLPGASIARHRFSIVVSVAEAGRDARRPIEVMTDNVLAGYPELRKCFRPGGLILRPDLDWHIGKAVQWLLTVLDMERAETLPIYVGERADEEAFAALRERGIGIVVGAGMRPTAARYVLDGVPEVRQFLAALADARSRSRAC
jgi:trehalose-phosphatase